MTRLYLATTDATTARRAWAAFDFKRHPLHVLFSYHYLPTLSPATKERFKGAPSRMLDSGAYSAYNAGVEIDMAGLIEETKNPFWTESVCLDVIGNGEASLKNALHMKAMGSPAFPVFHIGEPWDILLEYARQFDKVGLSCRFGESDKESFAWLDKCFARIWPKKTHSFGWIAVKALMRYPFHSADASSWITGPSSWGRWKTYGTLSVKSKHLHATADLPFYDDLQRQLQTRWKKELSRWT